MICRSSRRQSKAGIICSRLMGALSLTVSNTLPTLRSSPCSKRWRRSIQSFSLRSPNPCSAHPTTIRSRHHFIISTHLNGGSLSKDRSDIDSSTSVAPISICSWQGSPGQRTSMSSASMRRHWLRPHGKQSTKQSRLSSTTASQYLRASNSKRRKAHRGPRPHHKSGGNRQTPGHRTRRRAEISQTSPQWAETAAKLQPSKASSRAKQIRETRIHNHLCSSPTWWFPHRAGRRDDTIRRGSGELRLHC